MTLLKTNKLPIKIRKIEAFSDNYIWVITQGKNAVLVDPGDAKVCIAFLEKNQLELKAIMVTHHHHDHTGGIENLKLYCQNKQWSLTVYAPSKETTKFCDITLSNAEQVTISSLNLTFKVISVPGHTLDHIAYFLSGETPALFCGDTLFSGGCGRLFEGTASQMLTSLTSLSALPDKTQVFCAHEYTQANLSFALTVEPNNKQLIEYNEKVKALRVQSHSTIPSSIALEKQINPFLRCQQSSIQQNAKIFDFSTEDNELGTFTTIRRWKDQF